MTEDAVYPPAPAGMDDVFSILVDGLENHIAIPTLELRVGKWYDSVSDVDREAVNEYAESVVKAAISAGIYPYAGLESPRPRFKLQTHQDIRDALSESPDSESGTAGDRWPKETIDGANKNHIGWFDAPYPDCVSAGAGSGDVLADAMAHKLVDYHMICTHHISPGRQRYLVYHSGRYRDGCNNGAQRSEIIRRTLGHDIKPSLVNSVWNYAQTHIRHHEFGLPHARYVSALNGLYDTETGAIKPHSPLHFQLAQIQIAVDPDHPTPKWDALLDSITGGDDTMRDAILEALAYVVLRTARPNLGKIIMFWGVAGSGKSTLIRIVERLVSDGGLASVNIPRMCRRGQKYNHADAGLQGKDVILWADLPDDFYDFGPLKPLATWDSLTSNPKGEDEIIIRNYSMAILIGMNHIMRHDPKPEYLDRIYPIRFTRRFRGGPGEIKNLADQICETELPGIAYQLLERGRLLIKEQSFRHVPSHEEILAMDKGRRLINRFRAECLDDSPDAYTPVAAASAAFASWLHKTGNTMESSIYRNYMVQIYGETKNHRYGPGPKGVDLSWNGFSIKTSAEAGRDTRM